MTVESLDVADMEDNGGSIMTYDTACDTLGAPTATIVIPLFGNSRQGSRTEHGAAGGYSRPRSANIVQMSVVRLA